jgi:preprotein translocase subunit SecG
MAPKWLIAGQHSFFCSPNRELLSCLKSPKERLMALIGILAVLFLVLFLLLPLLEKYGSKGEQAEQDYRKYGRWILPLVAILLLAQLIKMLLG